MLCHRKLILVKRGKRIDAVQYWSLSWPLPHQVPADKSHAFLSCLLSRSAFPSRKISDLMLLISLQFFFLNPFMQTGVELQMSVSSPFFCVFGVCMCGKRKRVWKGSGREGGRVRWSTAVQINECAISGWVSSLLPAQPPACTNLRLNALYTHAPYSMVLALKWEHGCGGQHRLCCE